MEKDREISEEEYYKRYHYKSCIQRDYKLEALPRMFDFYSNGWVSVDRARPREDKIRLVVSSTMSIV